MVVKSSTSSKGTRVSEYDEIKKDVGTLLRDMRGAIDELLVQVDLGSKEAREAAQPLVERIENGWAELKARLEG
jgi:hypothetical protein